MRRPTAGFTMVEVLVAVLLLAVGLVGALAMQAHAMRSRQESALLTEALQAAATLADQIRADAAQSSAYLDFEFDAAGAGLSQAQDAPDADCAGAPCDGVTPAQRALHEFRRQLVSALPSARALVCRDSSVGQLRWDCADGAEAPIVIKIGWRSRNPGGAATAPAPGIALPVAVPAAITPPAPSPDPAPAPPAGNAPPRPGGEP